MKNGDKFKKDISELIKEHRADCSLKHLREGENVFFCEQWERERDKKRDKICDECFLKSLEWLLKDYKEPSLSSVDRKIIEGIKSYMDGFGIEIEAIVKRNHSSDLTGCDLDVYFNKYEDFVDEEDVDEEDEEYEDEDVYEYEYRRNREYDNLIQTISFDGNEYFKNLEINVIYTLEELGL